jgi:hypothetical protein
MPGGFAEFGVVSTGGQQFFPDKFGSPPHVILEFAVGTNGGNAEQVKEFGQESLPVLLDISIHSVSGVLIQSVREYAAPEKGNN